MNRGVTSFYNGFPKMIEFLSNASIFPKSKMKRSPEKLVHSLGLEHPLIHILGVLSSGQPTE